MRVCEVKYRIECFNKPQQNIYIFRISSPRSTKLCENLRNNKLNLSVHILFLGAQKTISDYINNYLSILTGVEKITYYFIVHYKTFY